MVAIFWLESKHMQHEKCRVNDSGTSTKPAFSCTLSNYDKSRMPLDSKDEAWIDNID